MSIMFGFALAIATFPPDSVIFPYKSVRYPIDLLFMYSNFSKSKIRFRPFGVSSTIL